MHITSTTRSYRAPDDGLVSCCVFTEETLERQKLQFTNEAQSQYYVLLGVANYVLRRNFEISNFE